jgi:hypothetical protein
MTDIERLRELHEKANPGGPFTSADFVEDGWGPEYAEWMAESLNALPKILADYERLRGMEERVKGAKVREVDAEGWVCGYVGRGVTRVALVPVPGGE